MIAVSTASGVPPLVPARGPAEHCRGDAVGRARALRAPQARCARRVVLMGLVGLHGLAKGARIAAAAAPPATDLPAMTPRQRVLALLSEGCDSYAPGDLGAAVDALVLAGNPTPQPAVASCDSGVGVWEVFYAPHIARITAPLGVRCDPIRYTLKPGGGSLVANVRYSHRTLGSGWLSASGAIRPHDDASLQLKFEKFWVDLGGAPLRPELGEAAPSTPGGESGGAEGAAPAATSVDRVIGALGRVLFLEQLATFPVLYLDPSLAVFQFPPLRSNIAVRRVA